MLIKNIKVFNSILYAVVLLSMFSCERTAKTNAKNTSFAWTERKQQELLNTDPRTVSVTDYIDWVEDESNGLLMRKTINGITYSCLYKPQPYEALLRLRGEGISDSSYNVALSQVEGLQYFTFKITSEDKSRKELLKVATNGPSEYYRRIEYCSFQMQSDIKLIDTGDTLDCVLFHFERVFNLAPEAVFVLAFPLSGSEKSEGEKYKGDKLICFEDGIFGLGKINMGIKKEVLNAIPVVNVPSYN